MNIEIKRLMAGDFLLGKRLFELLVDVENEVITGDDKLAELLKKDSFYGFVAVFENQVVGGLTAYEFESYRNNAREVYLYEIEVLEPYRQKGVATQLVEAAKGWARARGVKYMFVGTEKENLAAQKLYLKTGARKEGDIPHFEWDLG